jgi:hypothetical protein
MCFQALRITLRSILFNSVAVTFQVIRGVIHTPCEGFGQASAACFDIFHFNQCYAFIEKECKIGAIDL